jgi:hypothetical protein
VRQQLLDAISGGQPFRRVLRDLGLTSNQVWGLTRTDQEWSERLEAALTATRRDDIQHGTNAAYVAGGVGNDCREPATAASLFPSAAVSSNLGQAHLQALGVIQVSSGSTSVEFSICLSASPGDGVTYSDTAVSGDLLFLIIWSARRGISA